MKERGSQVSPLADFSCLTSASKGSMTVQWALLHPRGPQDDRAIAKRSCGTRDRSACAFQASCARSMSMRSAVFCRTLKVSLNSRSERRDRRRVGHHLRYELEKIE